MELSTSEQNVKKHRVTDTLIDEHTNGNCLVVIETPQEEEIRDVVLETPTCCVRTVARVETGVHNFYAKYRKIIVGAVCSALLIVYFMYFGYCMHANFGDEGSYTLLAISICIGIYFLIKVLSVTKFPAYVRSCAISYLTLGSAKRARRWISYALYAMAIIGLTIYIAIDVIQHNPRNSQALAGIFCTILICFIFSAYPSRVNWHPVFWGFVIQFVFASLVLRTEFGYNIFKWMGDVVYTFVRYSDKGSRFVLGATFDMPKAGFFFSTVGVIVFFNSMIFVLDYWGVLEFIILKIGGALAFCLGTGPVESVIAGANIFIGLSEAPLLVRPYLPTVTKSELHAIMTCGFASISGAFMAMFIQAGVSATHLLTAAVISAPAALAVSKLMYPETEEVDLDSQKDVRMRDDSFRQNNSLQALSDGAAFSSKLIAAIMVNMMAFVSTMNMVDHLLIWGGERAGIPGLTFGWLCSYLLYPIAYVMGAEPQDCGAIGSLLGIKLFATPFVAYVDLGKMIENRYVLENYVADTVNGTWHWEGLNVILDQTNTTLVGGFMAERSEVVVTYAMCGISAFPAIGFCMGTLIPLAPVRKPDIVQLIIRAFIAGNIANLLTGAIAGVMFSETSVPLPN